MAIVPVSVEFRGTRRVRTIFSGPLAAGAFTTLSMYSITAVDGGTNPINVLAIFAIASSANAVEFQIDSDITSGAQYSIGYVAVPGTDASTYTGTYVVRNALALTAQPNVEPEVQDSDPLIFFRDLAWNGSFQEDATGDLLTVTGRANWKGALTRRFGSDGINWDASYGAKTTEQVEAPSALAPSFGSTLLAQARLDPRTSQASLTLQNAPNDPDGFVYSMSIVPIDGTSPQTINVDAPPN